MLDLELVRSHFPAFDNGKQPRFFENAGGSFACRQTADALYRFYTETKVQPYYAFEESATAGQLMDRSHERWASALGVANNEIVFGPSTSANTYVLAKAFGELLGSGDEVIVTNQDHEANTGSTRRMAEASGATLREWKVDPLTGVLAIADLQAIVNENTRLIAFPHCSNVVGAENDVKAACALAKAVGAWTIVDGVSYAPHGFADIGELGPDVYLFSLYKTYSVHQGLMVLRDEMAEALPNQSHFFNASEPRKRMNPAGPDHAQVAAAGAVLDYVEATFPGHDSMRSACEAAKDAWQAHEQSLLQPLLRSLDAKPNVRVIGPTEARPGLHRCPTVAFVAEGLASGDIEQRLVKAGVMASSGNFYAQRVLGATGIADIADGVVRLSWVHYTSSDDIDVLLNALDDVLDT